MMLQPRTYSSILANQNLYQQSITANMQFDYLSQQLEREIQESVRLQEELCEMESYNDVFTGQLFQSTIENDDLSKRLQQLSTLLKLEPRL